MTYEGRHYQRQFPATPPDETNPAVVRLSDGTDAQVVRIDVGDTTTPMPLMADGVSGALVTADFAHHEIHEGDSYTADYKVDLGNGASANVVMITPNTTKRMHFIYEADFESETDFFIYEGATLSNNGTAIARFNRDRDSLNTSTMTVFHTPTITTDGTAIRSWHVGSGKSIGGQDRSIHEIKLKTNTKYIVRVTNLTTNNNYIALKLNWYEHTPK